MERADAGFQILPLPPVHRRGMVQRRCVKEAFCTSYNSVLSDGQLPVTGELPGTQARARAERPEAKSPDGDARRLREHEGPRQGA